MILGNLNIGMVNPQPKELQNIMVTIPLLQIHSGFMTIFSNVHVTIYNLCVMLNILKMENINIEMF